MDGSGEDQLKGEDQVRLQVFKPAEYLQAEMSLPTLRGSADGVRCGSGQR